MTDFSAKEPSLGYHYQIRYALYLLLKAKDKENPFIKLENLDDVEVGDLNTLDLHQTKFHKKESANLADSSVDLWKTLRVWSEKALSNEINLDNIVLVLVTTSALSTTSILHKLAENRNNANNIKEIIEKLNKISTKSINTDLQKSFDAYNNLSLIQKEKLIKSIYIKDNALEFDNLKREIKNELKITCLPNQIENVFENLQGWWYERCIEHLKGNRDAIFYEETRTYFVYLNEKFKSDNLPIDSTIREADIEDNKYDDRVFVTQLQELNIGRNTLRNAKRDFYRAFTQRSEWISKELLDPQEQIEYDGKLKDDWKRKFGALQDDIDGQTDDMKKESCKSFFTSFYINNHPQIFIRPRVTEPFIITGSCHMLADKYDIVWHPKYLKTP